MALFNFGKKREQKEKRPDSACCCGCPTGKLEKNGNDCFEAENGIYSVKVLGAGCKSCHMLYENVKQAVKDMGLSAEVEYVTDMQKIMEYGVMSMPALVVNEKVVAMGKVLREDEIMTLLR
ncbi:MAG: thioredoxin family protein [Eubacteriales bacterium]|nr:thioredoxin family protein [Eubacteriales bacterium]